MNSQPLKTRIPIPAFPLTDTSALEPGQEVVLGWRTSADGVVSWDLDGVHIVTMLEDGRIRCGNLGWFKTGGEMSLHLYGPVAFISADPALLAFAKAHAVRVYESLRVVERNKQMRDGLARQVADELNGLEDEAAALAGQLSDRLTAEQLSVLFFWLKPAQGAPAVG